MVHKDSEAWVFVRLPAVSLHILYHLQSEIENKDADTDQVETSLQIRTPSQ